MAKKRVDKGVPGMELLVCRNPKAAKRYDIEERLEAGMVLYGTEVKSLRARRGNLEAAYCRIDADELSTSKAGTQGTRPRGAASCSCTSVKSKSSEDGSRFAATHSSLFKFISRTVSPRFSSGSAEERRRAMSEIRSESRRISRKPARQ